jgi:hypothetical protein
MVVRWLFERSLDVELAAMQLTEITGQLCTTGLTIENNGLQRASEVTEIDSQPSATGLTNDVPDAPPSSSSDLLLSSSEPERARARGTLFGVDLPDGIVFPSGGDWDYVTDEDWAKAIEHARTAFEELNPVKLVARIEIKYGEQSHQWRSGKKRVYGNRWVAVWMKGYAYNLAELMRKRAEQERTELEHHAEAADRIVQARVRKEEAWADQAEQKARRREECDIHPLIGD